jgi:hypothetical protein
MDTYTFTSKQRIVHNMRIEDQTLSQLVFDIINGSILFFLVVFIAFTLLSIPEPSADFSDSGVNCIDDCLDIEEQGEPCTFETCQD